MRQVTVHAAKTHLSKLIEAALGGEDVVIAKGRKPVVRLVPIPQQPFKIGPLEGELGHGPDFFEPMPDDELDLWEGDR
ncbi:type II toxin-antitoxin system Phd/YefM family antitoxin [Methylobacterium sp. 17Sr1-1]|uniref:type II toxin-antitoxin system Phd/YefM family antitoxin n=1 Tax=Methylobacterium sp. 17Sr1-1 TaxID=2202826 RepID=UPI000D6F43A7|nr:type II toxin-antitoxin system Phd/YefM family antitoxin [Methylobacterium sp. 17Sr1-1]AWN55300.1 type II toxin-antitoxin system prevent-host-death family antitoxin [Methylobacterium sp. 17Sr1-1]